MIDRVFTARDVPEIRAFDVFDIRKILIRLTVNVIPSQQHHCHDKRHGTNERAQTKTQTQLGKVLLGERDGVLRLLMQEGLQEVSQQCAQLDMLSHVCCML